MNPFGRALRFLALLVLAISASTVSAQQPAPAAPASKAAQAPAEAEMPSKPELPFQIQLLETHIRFESNGDSRKEVHTVVKIINILGAHEFARLSFDYNRSFQQIEIPQVRVTHANGGTSEVLPSAVTDAPNPAVEPFPAYHDVRVKSVRILGLQENDVVEYRVITTITHHPLAPDFWLEHTFDRSGQVLEQRYELDLPGNMRSTTGEAGNGAVHVSVPWTDYRHSGEGTEERSLFVWNLKPDVKLPEPEIQHGVVSPDILVNSLSDGFGLARRLAALLPQLSGEDKATAKSWLAIGGPLPVNAGQKLRLSYDLVSHRLTTVDLLPGAEGFRVRPLKQILDSGYATAEEKCFVLAQLAKSAGVTADVVFYGDQLSEFGFPRPAFQKVFVFIQQFVESGGHYQEHSMALDPSIEVAPFGVISAQFRGKKVMSLSLHNGGDYGYNWMTLPETLPFPSRQRVAISADISEKGQLTAKVKYSMRGDNELLLRVAFYQTPKAKWKDVANLLALADGFRGEITSVDASDPKETKEPFTVEYELKQPTFVDWLKKPIRIPALLPQIGLPDATPSAVPGQAGSHIQLGTPLEVQTTMTLHLPAGTTIETPPGTSVARDYATFTSKYSSTQNTATASRHVNFLARELPADRATDYNAFVRAVQNDQSQRFTLVGSP